MIFLLPPPKSISLPHVWLKLCVFMFIINNYIDWWNPFINHAPVALVLPLPDPTVPEQHEKCCVLCKEQPVWKASFVHGLRCRTLHHYKPKSDSLELYRKKWDESKFSWMVGSLKKIIQLEVNFLYLNSSWLSKFNAYEKKVFIPLLSYSSSFFYQNYLKVNIYFPQFFWS